MIDFIDDIVDVGALGKKRGVIETVQTGRSQTVYVLIMEALAGRRRTSASTL